MGVTLSLLRLGESPKNVGAEFRPEGVESKEVSGLPSEEMEVSEQPSEGVLGEGSEWKEHAVALGLLEGAWNRKYSKVSPELGGGRSPKNAECICGWSWKDSEMFLERKTGCPLTVTHPSPSPLVGISLSVQPHHLFPPQLPGHQAQCTNEMMGCLP